MGQGLYTKVGPGGGRRARRAARGGAPHGHRHREGAQHLAHRRLLGERPERRGGRRLAARTIRDRLAGVAAGLLGGRPGASSSAAGRSGRASARSRSRAVAKAAHARAGLALLDRLLPDAARSTSTRAPPGPALPLLLQGRGGVGGGDRPAHRRAPGAPGRHPPRLRRLDQPGRSTAARWRAGSCRGWAGSPRRSWSGSAEGRLTTHAPSTYKIPTCRDVPEDFRVSLRGRPNREATVRRSKAVGEPPFPLAISVFHGAQGRGGRGGRARGAAGARRAGHAGADPARRWRRCRRPATPAAAWWTGPAPAPARRSGPDGRAGCASSPAWRTSGRRRCW